MMASKQTLWDLKEVLIVVAAVAVVASSVTGVTMYTIFTPETHGVCRTAMKDIWMNRTDNGYAVFSTENAQYATMDRSNEVVQKYTVECELRIPVFAEYRSGLRP